MGLGEWGLDSAVRANEETGQGNSASLEQRSEYGVLGLKGPSCNSTDMPPLQPEGTLHVCGPIYAPVQAPGMWCREQNVEPGCRQVRATEEPGMDQ